jgi:CRP-like cAMP-binding protein
MPHPRNAQFCSVGGRLNGVTVTMRQVRTAVPDIGELRPFARCTREQRARLRSLLTPIPVAAGEVLIEYGAPPREFGVIADGEVLVTALDGTELAVLGPGAIVGELALLRDVPTTARVTTLTPVVVYVGNRREFQAMLEVSPEIDLYVSHMALARLLAA